MSDSDNTGNVIPFPQPFRPLEIEAWPYDDAEWARDNLGPVTSAIGFVRATPADRIGMVALMNGAVVPASPELVAQIQRLAGHLRAIADVVDHARVRLEWATQQAR